MPELDLSELLRPEVRELRSYVPVAGDYRVRLDANEAPPLLSAAARRALAEATTDVAWERYPDATMTALRAALAARMGVDPNELLVGVGSDEVITLLLTVLAHPKARAPTATVVSTTPTFVMYRMSALARGMRVVEVPLDDAWDISVESMQKAIELAQPNLIFIASPNNPTGTMMSIDRVERVIEAATGSLVVIDEAYVDYASRDQLALYRAHPNVAILRTLSKVGFAALRIGWLLARPELIAELDKARQPYNMNTLSQRLGTIALRDLGDEIGRITRTVVDERKRVASALAELPTVKVDPSEANFLWLAVGPPASEVFRDLASRGVLVRSFHARGGRLAHRLRVTIGTRDENDAFLSALGDVLGP